MRLCLCDSQGVFVRAPTPKADSEGARRTQSEPKLLVSANRLCAARHAHLLHHALQCLLGATRTSQTAAVNKLMLIRIVTHPHRSSQRQASSTRANEFGPSCVRTLRTTIRCKDVTSCCFDDDDKAIEGLWRSSSAGVYRFARRHPTGLPCGPLQYTTPGSSGTGHTIRFTLPTQSPGCARHPLRVKFNAGHHDIWNMWEALASWRWIST